MSTNRDVSVGSTAEVLDSIISDYRKHSYTVKNFVKGIIINSANYDTFSYNLFLVGSDVSKLIQYALSFDKARNLLSDIQDTIKTVGQWFNSLDGLSQQKIKINFDYLVSMSNAFIKLASQPKPIQETQVNLSFNAPTVEQVEQSLADAQEEITPLVGNPSMSSKYPASRIQSTSLQQSHPRYQKYPNRLHPVDAALLSEMKEMGVNVEGANKEDVDAVWEKALLGRLYVITQEHSDVGAQIMKEFSEKRKSQGLSNTDVQSVLVKKNGEKDVLKEILDFASSVIVEREKHKRQQ